MIAGRCQPSCQKSSGSSPRWCHELGTLPRARPPEGNPSNEPLGLPTGRGQRCGTLRLHLQHPLLGLPHSQGSSGLRLPYESHRGLPHCINLPSRSLRSTNHHRTGNLYIGGGFPLLDHLLSQPEHVSGASGLALQKKHRGNEGNGRKPDNPGRLSFFLQTNPDWM
jgi:hypothetical protein